MGGSFKGARLGVHVLILRQQVCSRFAILPKLR